MDTQGVAGSGDEGEMSDDKPRFDSGIDVEDIEKYLDKFGKVFAEAGFDDAGDGEIDVEDLQKYFKQTGDDVDNYWDAAGSGDDDAFSGNGEGDMELLSGENEEQKI